MAKARSWHKKMDRFYSESMQRAALSLAGWDVLSHAYSDAFFVRMAWFGFVGLLAWMRDWSRMPAIQKAVFDREIGTVYGLVCMLCERALSCCMLLLIGISPLFTDSCLVLALLIIAQVALRWFTTTAYKELGYNLSPWHK